MKKLSFAKLYDFFAAVSAKQHLYLPVNEENGASDSKRGKEDGQSDLQSTDQLRAAKCLLRCKALLLGHLVL